MTISAPRQFVGKLNNIKEFTNIRFFLQSYVDFLTKLLFKSNLIRELENTIFSPIIVSRMKSFFSQYIFHLLSHSLFSHL